jgi:arylsulfatase
MTDDVGFAASSTFGGPIPTPTFDQLAKHGLKYNAFHTTAMCSPTRAALLTGRNHHSVGFGVIAELSTDAPGYDAYIPRSDAVIGRVLKDNGYDTAWFGKNHNTPPWDNTSVGPFDRWPNGLGFDYFYGFNAAMTNQFAPELVENRTLLNPPHSPGYILDKDLADRAIFWLHNQHNLDPSHPFFLYYAPGTSHSPHQAPQAWIDRFRGQFTEGWDKMREETFARQKSLGVIPANADLTPRPKQIPSWDSLTPAQQTVAVRMMQDYAAALAYCDSQIGRVLEALRASGQLQNTLVLFIQGDNGAAAEDLNGTSDDLAALGGIEGNWEHMLAHLADLGGPKSFENYQVGWAWSMDTPFQWAKEVASHFGGTRNGLVISWPGHTSQEDRVRSQFHHVVDIAPTIYEAAGIKPPAVVDGVKQAPLEGVSMLYTFEHPDAPSTHHSQYFELMGNQAFYANGWIASTTPEHMPWSHAPATEDPNQYKWELYDLTHDYSQAHDLAQQMPEKLAQLKKRFFAAAAHYKILPLNADVMGRVNNAALRPSMTQGRTRFVYDPSTLRYPTAAVPTLSKHWRVEVGVTVSNSTTSGMMVQRGDWFGGWGVMLEQGQPLFIYRPSDQERDVTKAVSSQALQPGRHQVMVDVSRPGVAPSGVIVLSVDGHDVARASIERLGRASGNLFVGRSGDVPLVDGLEIPSTFGGELESVTLDSDPHGHP